MKKSGASQGRSATNLISKRIVELGGLASRKRNPNPGHNRGQLNRKQRPEGFRPEHVRHRTAKLSFGNGPEIEKLGASVPYAERYDWIYAAIGLHPHEARHATEEHYAELDRLGKHPRVIAWGEIGLDYHYDHSPRDIQADVFRRQLAQARSAQRPIVIHCREA